MFFVNRRYLGGKAPKQSYPPSEVEPIASPSPSPMPVEAEVMSEAKKGVRLREKRAKGRASTILASRLMQKRSGGILLKEKTGE